MKIEMIQQANTRTAEKNARAIAKAAGVAWKDCEVFATLREAGRYASKAAGFQTMQAGG
mgnify:FL=1